MVMVFDLLTLRSAFTQVRTSVTSEPEVLVSRSARIDFAAYDQAVERITGADEYTPGRPPESNPFITAGEQ